MNSFPNLLYTVYINYHIYYFIYYILLLSTSFRLFLLLRSEPPLALGTIPGPRRRKPLKQKNVEKIVKTWGKYAKTRKMWGNFREVARKRKIWRHRTSKNALHTHALHSMHSTSCTPLHALATLNPCFCRQSEQIEGWSMLIHRIGNKEGGCAQGRAGCVTKHISHIRSWGLLGYIFRASRKKLVGRSLCWSHSHGTIWA